MSPAARASITTPAVRAAKPDDAGQIARLCAELGHRTAAAEIGVRLQRLAYSPCDRCWVAECDGVVTGWLQAQLAEILASGRRVEIAGLVVSKDARRTGVGRALVAAAERWAAELHATTVVVRSNNTREVSHTFYPGLGFVRTKTQHVYSKSLKLSPADELPVSRPSFPA